MIPVADATGRDLSTSGLAGFAGLIEHTSPTHRGTLGIPITAQPKALSNSISACVLWFDILFFVVAGALIMVRAPRSDVAGGDLPLA